VVWGSAGATANPAGRLKLDGALGAGELPHGPRQVVIGRAEDGALVPLGVVTGLENPHGAVIIACCRSTVRLMTNPSCWRGN
jgi:hypothetical protein